MGCVNCKPSRSSRYVVEKQQKKFTKRKSKKSISSKIRKLFKRKSRDANAHCPTKEEGNGTAVNDDLSRSSHEVPEEGLTSIRTDRENASTEISRNDSGREDGEGKSEESDNGRDGKDLSVLILKDSGIASMEEMAVGDGGTTVTKTKVSTARYMFIASKLYSYLHVQYCIASLHDVATVTVPL